MARAVDSQRATLPFQASSEARIAVWSDDDASPVDRVTSDMMEMVAARLEKAGVLSTDTLDPSPI